MTNKTDCREAFTEKEIADMAQAISDNGYQYEQNKERIRASIATQPPTDAQRMEAFSEKEIADMAQAISDNGFQYEANKSRIKAALQSPAVPMEVVDILSAIHGGGISEKLEFQSGRVRIEHKKWTRTDMQKQAGKALAILQSAPEREQKP